MLVSRKQYFANIPGSLKIHLLVTLASNNSSNMSSMAVFVHRIIVWLGRDVGPI